MSGEIPTVSATEKRARQLYEKQYSTSPKVVVSAPGRVNLIGEHTDYNDGFVMPLALDGRHTVVVGSKSESGVIRVVTEANVAGQHNTEFPTNRTAILGTKKQPAWADYVKGPILQFFKDESFPGFDIAIATDVPLGGGLSSSAALEVAMFTFLETLFSQKVDPKQKALLCQKAENDFVGMPCGNMDQFISVLGKANHALLLDCRSLETTYVPLTDPSVVLLVTNSNVKHELTGGEYAQRRAQCYEAVDVLKKTFPDKNIKALRDVTLDELKQVEAQLTPVVYKRARHVIGENDRCVHAAEAFKQGKYEECGKLMVASHNSLRDDYEVSCHELDHLVEFALQVDGVYGSRMTGGGFGGCTITLLKKDSLDQAIKHITKEYEAKVKKTPTLFSTIPGNGASVLQQ